jgi:hypothetical protein
MIEMAEEALDAIDEDGGPLMRCDCMLWHTQIALFVLALRSVWGAWFSSGPRWRIAGHKSHRFQHLDSFKIHQDQIGANPSYTRSAGSTCTAGDD